MTSPQFMLLDEPFSGIDPISVSDLKKIISGLKKRDIGILLSDHNVTGISADLRQGLCCK